MTKEKTKWDWFQYDYEQQHHESIDLNSQFQGDISKTLSQIWQSVSEPIQQGLRKGLQPLQLPLSIDEQANAYKINMEIPGLDKSSVSLCIEGNKLKITGEKQFVSSAENGINLHQERFFGKFQKILALPPDASLDNLSAEMVNGILTITIHKHQPSSEESTVIDIE